MLVLLATIQKCERDRVQAKGTSSTRTDTALTYHSIFYVLTIRSIKRHVHEDAAAVTAETGSSWEMSKTSRRRQLGSPFFPVDIWE